MLFTAAGAMRLPCPPDTEIQDMTHFLTASYGELFKLTRLSFVNSDENAFLKFYSADKIKIASELVDSLAYYVIFCTFSI